MLKIQENTKKTTEKFKRSAEKVFQISAVATFKFKFYQIYRNGSKGPLKIMDMIVSSKRTRWNSNTTDEELFPNQQRLLG
jgi:hypothetical protein